MDISFDLDSTIIPNGEEFDTENRGAIAKFFGVEKIRKGTLELINYLQKNNPNIHIYTTSYRNRSKIRFTLKYYGIKVNKVVNQSENQKVLKGLNVSSSKYPPAFNFDLHIDDLKGVEMEAEKYSFRVIIVEPTDNDWINTIVKRIET